MDTEEYLSDWWLWISYLSITILIIIGICKLVLEFPGLLDWRFIKQKLEDVEDPLDPACNIKRRDLSVYRPVVRISREVVRKISNRKNGNVGDRVRKKGVCVMVDFYQPVVEGNKKEDEIC